MFSQLFLLSLRGDVLIFKDFRNDIGRWTTESFFRASAKGDEPIFSIDGIQFIYTKHNGMYFVLVAKTNVSPSLSLELLNCVAMVIKDYCGVLNEEAVRNNFMLIYEIVDEVVDFGYPQGSSSEELIAFIKTNPILARPKKSSIFPDFITPTTTSSDNANQSITIIEQKKENEIFVDLLEKITVHFGASGQTSLAEIEGTILVRNYIKGRIKLMLGLNEGLTIGEKPEQMTHEILCLDQCNFHECCQFTKWDTDRTLVCNPPCGEFALVKYRYTEPFTPPFKIVSFVEEPGHDQLDIFIKLSSEFPPDQNANKVVLKCQLPKSTVSASCELERDADARSYEFDSITKSLIWKLGKVIGGYTTSVKIKLNLANAIGNFKREVGPIGMEFEFPMYRISPMQIRYLCAMENEKVLNARKWVRSITKAESYISRVNTK